MAQTNLPESRYRLRDGSAVLLSLVALLSALILVRHLFLGVTLFAGVISTYLQVRQGDIRGASVLAGLWVVFAATVYTSQIPVVLLSAVVCLLCYTVWQRLRGN